MNSMKLALVGLVIAVVAGCSRIDNSEIDGSSVDMEEVKIAARDWPWWRGERQDNHSQPQDVPVQWDMKRNVIWKTPVGGRGHSSPSIWGRRVFLTTADDSSEEQQLLCFDRGTGNRLWSKTIHTGGFPKMHAKNSHASPTPACDAERVYAVFYNAGAIHVTAFDHEGKQAWQTNAGQFKARHGYGASPVVYKSLLIVIGDNDESAFMTALHRPTGKIVWRKSRPSAENYATPVVGRVAGKDQLIIAGGNQVASYNPATGDLLWSCSGPTDTCANSVAFSGDMVLASGGYPGKEILCVRADGSGDVSDTHVLWREGRGVAYVPSAIGSQGRFYVVNDKGMATCFEGKSGKRVWQRRLGGAFTSSPTLVNGNLYAPSEGGKVHVLRADTQYEQRAVNDVGEPCFASPVICGNRIYLRTLNHLYCIGNTETAAR